MPESDAQSPLPIAVLISGGGTTLRNLIERIDAGNLNVEIKLVVSSSTTAKGLRFASDAKIPTVTLESQSFADAQTYSQAVFRQCRAAKVGLVVMAGFLKFLPIPGDFENRVMNIHPALIPAFCGQGMYGLRVHQAVLDYGAKITGCTVHFVDNEYDHGPIILQRAVDVHDNDTAETLQARVFATECELYPEAIANFAAGHLQVNGRVVAHVG